MDIKTKFYLWDKICKIYKNRDGIWVNYEKLFTVTDVEIHINKDIHSIIYKG